MEHELYSRLGPVRRRQRARVILDASARGLLAGASAAIVIGLARWPAAAVAGPSLAPTITTIVLPSLASLAMILGAGVGAWRGARRAPGWRATAAAVDRRYQLRDRTLTALDFLDKSRLKPLEESVIADCLRHLASLDARAVVPGRVPVAGIGGLVLLGVAVATSIWPLGGLSGAPSAQNVPVQPAQAAPPAAAPDPAAGARLRADLQWQPAPAGQVSPGQVRRAADDTLESVLAAADHPLGRAPAQPGAPPAPTIDTFPESQPWPLEYRRMIRAYFDAIRPPE